MTISTKQWQSLTTGLIGLLLSLIAWNVNQATDQLRAMNIKIAEIGQTLAVAVFRLEDHERRLGNLETLYMKTTER